MPNHIRNVWKIKNIEPEKIDYVLNKLAIKAKPIGSLIEKEYIIDFDLIIPEPRFKKDCPKQFIMNSKSHAEKLEGREWFNWYEWHVTFWGTKWNAYDGYTKIGKTQITFVFNTAWSFPEPIADKLTELGYDLELRFADEDIGSNCGKFIYNATTKEWTERSYEMLLPDPEKFAKYIWSHY